MARKIIKDGDMIKKIQSLSEYQKSMAKNLSRNPSDVAKINRGAANIIANYFSEYIDSMARSGANLSHVYETGNKGSKSHRLFVKKISSNGSSSEISFNFKNAKIAEDSGYIFKYRAKVMEQGGQISISPKTVKFLKYFTKNGRIRFAKSVSIKSVGGKNNMEFTNQFNSFMSKNAKQVLIDSKYFDKISLRMREKNQLYIPRLSKSSISSAISDGVRDAAMISQSMEDRR